MSDTPSWLALRNVTSRLLESRHSAWSLRRAVIQLTTILTSAAAAGVTRRDGLADGDTRTPQGLALSPAMAATCADDFVRTIEFIRGAHDAVTNVRQRCPDRPARILYVGCGPYATLAVPLMSVFGAADATFTLLDIHHTSVTSARSVVDTLGLTDRVSAFDTIDAGSYEVDPDRPPDVILMEIMQACLEAEPQVAISRHLLAQAPDAILVPEEIRVELMLADLSREFDAEQSGPIPRDRIPVATVFVLSRETVESWRGIDGTRLPAATVRMPAVTDRRYQPMLFTVIRTYGTHVLEDYASGLTSPRVLSVEGMITPGTTLRFHYELGAHPRLVGVVGEYGRPSGA